MQICLFFVCLIFGVKGSDFMSQLHLATLVTPDTGRFVAVTDGSKWLPLQRWTAMNGLDLPASIDNILLNWSEWSPVLRRLLADPAVIAGVSSGGNPIADVEVVAPLRPGQVFCTIGNYADQLIEAALDKDDGPNGSAAAKRRAVVLDEISTRKKIGSPYICLKGAGSVAGPYSTLEVAAGEETLDWEVELAVVIGAPAWQVNPEDVHQYIAGYCVANDITLRQNIFRADLPVFGTDWLQSKSKLGWLPLGPWFIPSWQINYVPSLELTLKLNGQTMQSSKAENMLFDVARQVSYISQHTPLNAGDIICTGSPAGFGSHYGRFLQPGDVVEASIKGLGVQRVICK